MSRDYREPSAAELALDKHKWDTPRTRDQMEIESARWSHRVMAFIAVSLTVTLCAFVWVRVIL